MRFFVALIEKTVAFLDIWICEGSRAHSKVIKNYTGEDYDPNDQ